MILELSLLPFFYHLPWPAAMHMTFCTCSNLLQYVTQLALQFHNLLYYLDIKEGFIEFPFAVLEIKLKVPIPEWVDSLMQNAMLRQVKFSKFQHGIASFNPQTVPEFPYWFDFEELKEKMPIQTLDEKLNVSEEGHV